MANGSWKSYTVYNINVVSMAERIFTRVKSKVKTE